MLHQEKLDWMARWCAKHQVALVTQGECGFGRDCVGVSANGNYPEYTWYDKEYSRSDRNGEVWCPEDAYHKHDCVAVLGRGEKAESQLYDWLKWFEDNGFVVECSIDPLNDDGPSARMTKIAMGQHHVVRMVRKST